MTRSHPHLPAAGCSLKEAREFVQNLYATTVECQPVHFDWSSQPNADFGDSGEGWRLPDFPACSDWGKKQCRAWLKLHDMAPRKGEEPATLAAWREAVEQAEIRPAEPMTSCYYPLERDCLGKWASSAEDAQVLLAQEPCNCVVVEIDGEPALALAACGSDFSWDICLAYVALGFLPPLHVCDLPSLAGWQQDKRATLVLAACERSVECAAFRLKLKTETLGRLAAELDAPAEALTR
jgi:hypothetical protein